MQDPAQDLEILLKQYIKRTRLLDFFGCWFGKQGEARIRIRVRISVHRARADSDSKKAESVTLVLKRLIAIETEEASNEGIQTNWGSLWRIFLRMTQRLGSLRILLITN